jgi:glycosyltransferase involved in cell wall biosynthesis
MLDPRGVILSGGDDVIKRHHSYARDLAKKSKGKKISLLILSASTSHFNKYQLGNLQIKRISNPTLNAYNFAKKAFQAIKNNYDVKLLVAGDPWESFWSANILSKYLPSKVPIQVQLHGDIASPTWRKINLRNKFRYLVAKFSLPKASGIRTVSSIQSQLITNAFKVRKERITVIPVPIGDLKLASTKLRSRPKSLALVGRVQNDRGLLTFLKLIKSLTLVRNDFNLLIIGDGPDRKNFLEKLMKIIPKSKVSFFGYLSESDLKKIWKKVGVLISTAPAESYGRAMREALVAGIPVWATRSSGVQDLLSKSNKTSIKILDLTKSSKELSRELDQLFKAKVELKFRNQIIKDNSTYSRLLAKSWLKLID